MEIKFKGARGQNTNLTHLIPNDEASAQHECENECWSTSLKGIVHHVVRVDCEQHQREECDVGGVLHLVCKN